MSYTLCNSSWQDQDQDQDDHLEYEYLDTLDEDDYATYEYDKSNRAVPFKAPCSQAPARDGDPTPASATHNRKVKATQTVTTTNAASHEHTDNELMTTRQDRVATRSHSIQPPSAYDAEQSNEGIEGARELGQSRSILAAPKTAEGDHASPLHLTAAAKGKAKAINPVEVNPTTEWAPVSTSNHCMHMLICLLH